MVPKKKKIPKAVREAVWLEHVGRAFEHKCLTPWCSNTITVFDYQTGHNIPESKGGPTSIKNLIPLCGRCNLSMGNQYTFDAWSKMYTPFKIPLWKRCLHWFKKKPAIVLPVPLDSCSIPTSH